jgi:uncharacterized cofD-like protein
VKDLTVVVGGGHGASVSLRAALEVSGEVGGVITVADDGGSSGRLARELGVLPMGDLRQCLASIAGSSQMVDLVQHRFPSGPLEGHVVGNLIVAAVAQQTGSFMAAIEVLAELLGSRGKVVPSTLEPVRLVCEVRGNRVEGQVAVANVDGPIAHLELDPEDPKAYPGAVELLNGASRVVLGPGSLFTSVLPPLLVPGIRETFLACSAQKFYVCNLVAPPGETAEFDAVSHLQAIQEYVGADAVDVIVAHRGRSPHTQALEVDVDVERLESLGPRVVTADLLPPSRASRHDTLRLSEVFRDLWGEKSGSIEC